MDFGNLWLSCNISFAFRPLTLSELRIALVVSADTTYKSLRECRDSELCVDTDEDMERIVCDLSKGLAEIIENDSGRVAQFVHQSVKDFLVEQGFQILDHSTEGTVVGRGHFWLSRSCIRYFLMEGVQDFSTSTQDDVEERRRLEESFPMLHYSVKYLYWHLQEVDVANMSQNDIVALEFEPTNHILQRSWYDAYQQHRCRHYYKDDCETLLHAASYYNLIGVVKAILTRISWADHKDQSSRTPLSLAAARGHQTVVEMLMGRDDVDVNSKNNFGDTPLSIAAARDRKSIVKMLINREDVDVNSKNNFGDTPLSIAATRKRETIVKMLMNREEVDVNSKNRYGETPLTKAAQSGQLSIATFLLERSIALSPNNWQLSMALCEAAREGNCGVVELLLQQTANPNARDSINRTPLLYAAAKGRYDVVKLLLRRSANVNARDNKIRTPLLYAASKGRYDIAKLLLQENADVNVRDKKNRTPLSYAASWGHCEIVKLLLEEVSNADQKDRDGRTPFSYAVYNGHKKVVEAFLERGQIDINSKDSDGRSPLSWAITGWNFRNVPVVKLLLKQNDIVVTEEDRDLMKKESYYLEVDFSLTEEEEDENEIEEERSEEERKKEESEVEQNSRATKMKRNPFEAEQPRKRIKTNMDTQ